MKYSSITFLTLFCFLPLFSNSETINLSRVLESTLKHYPSIKEAQERINQSKASLAGTDSIYDSYYTQEIRQRTSGYYDGVYSDQKLVAPIVSLGGKFYASYRLSKGDFPVYEDEHVTLDNGEIGIGLSLPLLRNRAIDSQRLNRANRRFLVENNTSQKRLIVNDVLYQAATAYIDWLYLTRQLSIYEHLYETSINRQAGIRRQVKLGDVATIALEDVNQSILKRKLRVLKTKNAIEIASQQLSVFWRTENGIPIVTSRDHAPKYLPVLPEHLRQTKSKHAYFEKLKDDALNYQPALIQLEIKRKRLKGEKSLAKNELMPKLDLDITLSNDLGNGEASRDGVESYVGITFKTSFQRRKAKRKLQELQSKLAELDIKQQRYRELLLVTLNNAQTKFNNYLAQAAVAKENVMIAKRLETQEHIRFAEGESDLFVLNQREQNTAQAKIEHLEAQVKYLLSSIDLIAKAYQMEKAFKSGELPTINATPPVQKH